MKLFLFSLVLSTVGCGSKTQSKADDQNKGAEGPEPYSLTYTDVMDFSRGVESSYEIKGSFTLDDVSQITIDELPASASYQDDLLTWMPPCTLKPENGQFARGYEVFRIRINLANSKTDSFVQKPAILLVHLQDPESICED